MRWKEQMAATREVLRLLPYVPDCVWQLALNDEDDACVLNIFISRDRWKDMATKLSLPETPSDKGEDFVSYNRSALLISFIDEETT